MTEVTTLRHLAFIMDGNRRWADRNGVPRVRGHKEGIYAIERVIEGCIRNEIKFLTVFAFSTENWNRSRAELRYLSRLMFIYLSLLRGRRIGGDLLQKVKINFIGDIQNFGKLNYSLMNSIEEVTRDNSEIHVMVAVSYGGRDEIVSAVNRSLANGKNRITKIDIEENLYCPDVPFPDLIVRTGDEKRLSNFLTWQSAYSELFYLQKLWPDISSDDVQFCKVEYESRERKFGS